MRKNKVVGRSFPRLMGMGESALERWPAKSQQRQIKAVERIRGREISNTILPAHAILLPNIFE